MRECICSGYLVTAIEVVSLHGPDVGCRFPQIAALGLLSNDLAVLHRIKRCAVHPGNFARLPSGPA